MTRQTRQKAQETLSKKVGDMLLQAHNTHIEELVHTTKRMGDYIITVAVEEDEGKYEFTDKEVKWSKPQAYGSMHFEVIVLDRDFMTFIPYLDIEARILDSDGVIIGEGKAKYIWHSFAPHYGLDVVLPNEGKYRLDLKIKIPKFERMHKTNGKRYLDEIAVTTEAINIMPPGASEDDLFPEKEK